jgi:hypothetical protein
MSFSLKRVYYMPKELEPNVLYVSDEFDIAMHLCACGCGTAVKTPLGPTEWSVKDTPTGPTLRPSVGNWQQPCRSHYLITRGEIEWSYQWSAAQIASGRRREQECREAYYGELERKRGGFIKRTWARAKEWTRKWLGR